MSFGELALILLCGIAGPLLAGLPRLALPLVVGELAAGVVIGRTGFDLVDTAEPTLRFLSDLGFALLMFAMGAGLPLRSPGLRPALGRAVGALAVSLALAVPVALGVSALGPVDRPALLSVLLVSSSAALVVPALTERGLVTPGAGMTTVAWVTAADLGAIAALPVVAVSGPAWRAVTGGAVVTGAAVAIFLVWHDLRRRAWFRRYRHLSKRRRWGLDLRIALLALLTLSWLAVTFSTSILVAGFSAGVVLALIGEPHRLAWQVLGLGEGFLVPLFIVTLGAQIDLRALVDRPRELLLVGLLLAGGLVVHAGAALTVRLGVGPGLVATAQMGVPAAVVSLGLREGLLDPAEGAAVLAAALGSVAALTAGTRLMARAALAPPADSVGE